MRLGVDSYSYHRLLGELRPGEAPPAIVWRDPVGDVLAEARRVDADVLSLQTSLLGVSAGEARSRLAGTGAPELVLAWGAPAGLRYGRDPAALADLTAWIGVAAALECTLVRVVLGSPPTRPVDPPPGFFAESARALAAAARVAATAGIALAVENHGDVTTTQLLGVLDACGAANVACASTRPTPCGWARTRSPPPGPSPPAR